MEKEQFNDKHYVQPFIQQPVPVNPVYGQPNMGFQVQPQQPMAQPVVIDISRRPDLAPGGPPLFSVCPLCNSFCSYHYRMTGTC